MASGDRVGNGGDVVVCGDKVELLDIYEAKRKGFKFLEIKDNAPEIMLKDVLTERLLPFQKMRASKYLKDLEQFYSESEMLSGIHLNDVDDSGVVAIPVGCELQQIIVQLSDDDIQSDGFRYTVNKDLWDKLDNFNKMALMLHELIFKEIIESKSGSSLVVRSMVGQLLKDKMDNVIYLNSISKIKSSEHSRDGEFTIHNSLIEFYNTTFIVPKGQKFKRIIDSDGAEYIEYDVTNAFNRSRAFWKNNEIVIYGLCRFEELDGSIVLIKDNKGKITGKKILKNETSEISSKLFYTPSEDIVLAENRDGQLVIIHKKPFNLKIERRQDNGLALISAELLNIESAKAGFYHNSIEGIFDLSIDHMFIPKENRPSIELTRNGYFYETNKYQKIENNSDVFECQYFGKNILENLFSVRNCDILNTKFNLNLDTKIGTVKTPISPVTSKDHFTFSKEGVLFIANTSKEVIIKNSIILGKAAKSGRFKKGKDVIIPAGSYRIRRDQNLDFFIRNFDKDFEYKLEYETGKVYEIY